MNINSSGKYRHARCVDITALFCLCALVFSTLGEIDDAKEVVKREDNDQEYWFSQQWERSSMSEKK